MLNGAEDIRNVMFEEPFSMIQGNESKGLPAEYSKIGKSNIFLILKTLTHLISQLRPV
jgi:hypothetical protein